MRVVYFLIAFILIFQSGYSTLVVGTTGDYPPFSEYDKSSNSYFGKDIFLIKKFANANNEDIKFVKTTWKAAEEDLKNKKYEVFVGGTSINIERKKDFLFSTPLIAFQKAAMTQCKNSNKYKSFADIDNPQTLIIENRGGTNEELALKIIKNANLLIVENNTLAMKYLKEGFKNMAPDIMITDSTEIDYQHSINPELCKIPVEIDSTKSYKAFMFNKDKQGEELRDKFNKWLKDNPSALKEYRD